MSKNIIQIIGINNSIGNDSKYKFISILDSILNKSSELKLIYNNINGYLEGNLTEHQLLNFMKKIYNYSKNNPEILDYFLNNNSKLFLNGFLILEEYELFDKLFLTLNIKNDNREVNLYDKTNYLSQLLGNINNINIGKISQSISIIHNHGGKVYFKDLDKLIISYPDLIMSLNDDNIQLLNILILDIISYGKYIGDDKSCIFESLIQINNPELLKSILTGLKAKTLLNNQKLKMAITMLVKNLFYPYILEFKEYCDYMGFDKDRMGKFVQLIDYAGWLLQSQYKIYLDEEKIKVLKGNIINNLDITLDPTLDQSTEKSIVYNLLADKIKYFLSIQNQGLLHIVDFKNNQQESIISNYLENDDYLRQVVDRVDQLTNIKQHGLEYDNFVLNLIQSQNNLYPYILSDILEGNEFEVLSSFVILGNKFIVDLYSKQLVKKGINLNEIDDNSNLLIELILPGLSENNFTNQIKSLQILIKNGLTLEAESLSYFLDLSNNLYHISNDNILSILDLYLNNIGFEDDLLNVLFIGIINDKFEIIDYIMSYYDFPIIEDVDGQPLWFYGALISIINKDLKYLQNTIKYYDLGDKSYNEKFILFLYVLEKTLNSYNFVFPFEIKRLIIEIVSNITNQDLNSIQIDLFQMQEYKNIQNFLIEILKYFNLVLKK